MSDGSFKSEKSADIFVSGHILAEYLNAAPAFYEWNIETATINTIYPLVSTIFWKIGIIAPLYG